MSHSALCRILRYVAFGIMSHSDLLYVVRDCVVWRYGVRILSVYYFSISYRHSFLHGSESSPKLITDPGIGNLLLNRLSCAQQISITGINKERKAN